MKLKLTPQRLAANRANCKAGGLAYARKMKEQYEANPKFCSHCNLKLPQEKKNNKFCNSSCAASFNNKLTPKRSAKTYKCKGCDTQISGRGKYCTVKCYDYTRRKYKTKEEQIEAVRKKVREVSANYRAKVKNQTPPDADRKSIKEFYDSCPKGYEVDHIIPISKGGLHTLENLQYLTIAENRKKSNKIIA
jgi:5-methylcytosine-specific restriction endonuclease McrA